MSFSSVSAIIPMKLNSNRVPQKNFKLFNGKPLFWYVINTLLECGDKINKIIINVDNEILIDKVKKEFSNEKIIFYKRPKHLFGDDISINLIIRDTIKNNKKTDYYLQTHVTNPLVKKETFIKALDIFMNSNNDESLFSVKKWQTRLYDKEGKAVNHDPTKLIPTQNLKPLYEENSCIYIFTEKQFMRSGRRITMKAKQFEMNSYESEDIDWIDDFYRAESLLKKQLSEQKTVLITGINGGIGSYLGFFFKNIKRWEVIGLDINSILEKNNYDEFYICDVSSEKDLRDVKKKIKNRKIDLIINNAAIQICKSWADTTFHDWNKTINSNLSSVYLVSTIFKDLLQQNSSIINISSVHSNYTSNNIGAYATSKGGINTLTRSMALEYAKDHIRVNGIAPGAVRTQMLEDSLKRSEEKNAFSKLIQKHPLKRIGEPNDIAEIIYFLSDYEKSGFITGQVIPVDGGVTIKLSSE